MTKSEKDDMQMELLIKLINLFNSVDKKELLSECIKKLNTILTLQFKFSSDITKYWIEESLKRSKHKNTTINY